MNKIKLIITDMDGTLLDDNHQINGEFWEVFEKMKQNNICFSVASGRQYYNLLNNFISVKNDVLFIAENGSYVVYRGKELFSDVMSRDSVEQIVQKARDYPGISIILCGKKSGYLEKSDIGFLSVAKKFYDEIITVDDLLSVEDDILKISICEHSGVKEGTEKHFRDDGSDFNVTVSTSIWLDIASKTANKGEAVEIVQNIFNITKEQTVVFGDYLNDIEMMKKASYSFAMKNAHPEVKRLAACIAGSNNENGVVEKIKEILGGVL